MTVEFQGRIAWVTGGSRGIGRAVSMMLANKGTKVAVSYRSDMASADETKNKIVELGGEAMLVCGDVSSQEDVRRIVSEITEKWGKVDILVNCAGLAVYETHAEMTIKSWRTTMATNVEGSLLPILAVKDGMLMRRWGRIVCLSSIAALRPRANMIAYSASKAAIVGMVRSFADALKPNVRINAVAPGPTDTDMMSALPDNLKGSDRIKELPLGRLATPDEIADVVLFLLSDKSTMINGQMLSASAGEVMIP